MMKKNRTFALSVGLAMVALVAAGPALAVNIPVNWVAEKINLTMPGTGEVVPMWGYREASDPPGSATVPGPMIRAITGDTLTINLSNQLHLGPGLLEPTSIVIPGLPPTLANPTVPTWNDGATGLRTSPTQRVRSFTHEALPNGSATYEWDTLKPGTYLIQSGTHPSVQIQMGLYAVLKVDDADGFLYGEPFDNEIDLIFSEIDPVLHNAVATGNYGPGKAVSSTMDYEPKYFLRWTSDTGVSNGMPYYSAGDLPISVVPGNNLVRFINAGLQTRVPQLLGAYMTLLGEDGNQAPFPKDQSSLLLPAAKTIDVIINNSAVDPVDVPVYDRRLAFSPHVVQAAVLAEKFGTFRSGQWYLDANGNGAWDPDIDTTYASFGGPGDLPVVGDWNGSGTDQIGVFRNGAWYLDANSNGAWDSGVDTTYVSFGGHPSDIPVIGDWDGDGTDQIGVFRNGAWYLDADGDGAWDQNIDTTYASFGGAGDIPVIGDWIGDGSSQVGVFRNGAWYLDMNGNGVWNPGVDVGYASFGAPSDIPFTGNW